MRIKILIILIILFIFICNVYTLFTVSSLKKKLEGNSAKEIASTNLINKLGDDIKNLYNRTDNLSKDIDTKTTTLQNKIAEINFFNTNTRNYSILGNRFQFNYCCIFSENGATYLGYDLLVENPIGSGNFEDFGTTSYTIFNSADKIKNINITEIGNSKIYKVVINSEFRHTEGIIYPNSDTNNSYVRLYDLTEIPNQNLYVDHKTTTEGYRFLVSHQLNNQQTSGEYVLKQIGKGYKVEVIKGI